MTCVDNTMSVEHFEKEAMAWDSLQMRCKMSTVKEEPRGRPKRRPDRKAKRPQGEKKTNGRVLKAAKLSHNQAGPCLAVNKIKAKDERIAAEDKENAVSNHAPKQMSVLTTNRLTQKLHTGIYGQGKASGRILRRKPLGELKAPNVDSELQRILGAAPMEESSAPEQKGDAVDCSKDSSHVGLQCTKCDAVGDVVSQQEPATSTAVSAVTDSNDVMDDAPRTEDNDEEAILKRTANSIITSLEPEKMFKCAGYVDSLKNDLRKMLRNNNPQLYGELMAKFQLKRAKSLEVYSRTPPEIFTLENDPEALAHDPALPTSAANAAAPSSPPHACSGANTPGVLMDTSNNIKEGLSHGVLQPKTIFLQGHPHGTENEGYSCNRAAQKDATEFSALSLNCRGGKADHHLQGVVAPSHCMQITRDLSHVMLNSQSDPTLFQANTAQQMLTSQECGLMAPNSPQPHSLFTASQLSPHQHGTHQGQTLNQLNKPGWDFLEIVDNQYVCHLPSRPQPVMVTRLSPPKMYPQKMF